MRVIIEGCDNTGKSTLAKALFDRYDDIKNYIHITKDDPHDYTFYREMLRKTDVIFDRQFIGEMVYPEIFGRQPKLDSVTFEGLLKYARLKGYKIFILYTDLETLKSRIKSNEYDEVVSNLERINNAFIKLAKKYDITLLDTSKTSLDEIFRMVEDA